MPDKPVCPQINIPLDKDPDLLGNIKCAASDRNISGSELILEAILAKVDKISYRR